jgi:hypothetical protein
MLRHQSRPIPIRAADCNDRPSAVNRSSPEAVSAYDCESCHLGLIVAVNKRQNENKALCQLEIGQTKKKPRGRIRWGSPLGIAFPRVSWRNGWPWLGGFALKMSASGPQQRRNGAFSNLPGPDGSRGIVKPSGWREMTAMRQKPVGPITAMHPFVGLGHALASLHPCILEPSRFSSSFRRLVGSITRAQKRRPQPTPNRDIARHYRSGLAGGGFAPDNHPLHRLRRPTTGPPSFSPGPRE